MELTVNILFFGATAEAVGTRRLEVRLPEPKTSGDVFRELVAEYPRLSEHKLLFAVNQEYTDGKNLVADGDELAVFTAVSGG